MIDRVGRAAAVLGLATMMAGCRAPAGAPGASNGPPGAGSAAAPIAAEPLDRTWERDPGKVLSPGEPAPNFEGIAHTGMRVRLSSFQPARVVVYFYDADRAPGATSEARGFRDAWLRFSGKLGMVLGISSDDRISHRDFATEERLPFLLVADEGHAIARAFGVPIQGGREKPVTFIVGPDGKIERVYTEVDPDKQADQVVEALSSK